jgi:hypothetical protein
LKNRVGRRRTADARQLLRQVEKVFAQKLDEIGARKGAKELGISVQSFYNYSKGKTVPDMDVLRKVKEKWQIKWKYLDPSEVFSNQKCETPEQFVMSFLDEVHARDIEVVKVGPKSASVLQVTLNIRFSA